MNHRSRTKQDLLEEISALKHKIRELESSEAERQRAREVIRKERDFSDFVINSIPGIFYILDAEGRLERWNRKMEEISGYPAAELIGQSPLNFLRRDCRAMAAQRMMDISAAGAGDVETVLVSKSGKEIPCYFYGHRIILDGKPRVIGIGIDMTELKKTQRALLESERKYRQLFMNAPAAIFEIDYRSNRFISLNDIVPVLTGYSREELMERGPSGLLTAESQKAYLDRLIAMKEGKDVSASQEYQFRKKDGTILWVNMNMDYEIEEGQPVTARIVAHDISARKTMEAAICRSEERYRSIIEQMADGYFELDLEGRFIFVNNAECRNIGCRREDLIGLMANQYVNEQHIKEIYRIYGEVYRTGEPVAAYDLEIVRKDGSRSIHEISISLIKDDEGRPSGFRGVARDVTERKKMEMALKESDERFKAVFDGSLDGVFIHDLDGNFLDLNQAALDKLGYGRTDIPSLNFVAFLDAEGIKEAIRVRNELLRTGVQQIPSEMRIKRKNGSYLDVETKSSVIYHDGRPYAIIGISRDVTDRKQAEEERYRYEKLHGVLEMAGTVCHELNQPMQIISGYSEMLLKHVPENDPNREKLEKINRQIHRMSNITKKLMRIRNYETQDYAGFGRIISINEGSAEGDE